MNRFPEVELPVIAVITTYVGASPEDVETLQDLITGAFRNAHEKAGNLAAEKMGPLSQGGDPFGGMLG